MLHRTASTAFITRHFRSQVELRQKTFAFQHAGKLDDQTAYENWTTSNILANKCHQRNIRAMHCSAIGVISLLYSLAPSSCCYYWLTRVTLGSNAILLASRTRLCSWLRYGKLYYPGAVVRSVVHCGVTYATGPRRGLRINPACKDRAQRGSIKSVYDWSYFRFQRIFAESFK